MGWLGVYLMASVVVAMVTFVFLSITDDLDANRIAFVMFLFWPILLPLGIVSAAYWYFKERSRK